METRAHHVLIGLFTIFVFILAILFALWAANWASNRSWDTYQVVFKEAVTGLGTGGIVQYNGISVGEVQNLTLDPDDPRRVIALIRLRAGTPVKIDTKAKLAFIGLTGVAQIQLSGGLPESPRLLPKPGQRYPVIETQPSALQNVAEAASDIVERVRLILSDQNIARLSGALDDLHQLTTTLSGEKQDIAVLLKNLRDASGQLNQVLGKANGSLDTLDSKVINELPPIMTKLDRTLTALESASKNADSILGGNREAIASFSQNGLTQVGPTLTDLRSLIRDLRRVATKLDNNPGGYITGRTRPEEFDKK
ncbi:MAG TPA: MlaD family protein [Arenimonas sp.]|uniref:MlaD family protein n=1 Tax=Arenimonas sp. TaxID=1872635 RepID=UPI002B6BA294|nr:MlaD family protein [Arenimonas sp.]HMB56742.1 MlaD family protein [Arenimonas sp.]